MQLPTQRPNSNARDDEAERYTGRTESGGLPIPNAEPSQAVQWQRPKAARQSPAALDRRAAVMAGLLLGRKG